MTRNRKSPTISVIETMNDREKAILLVLSESDQPLDHKQICMKIAQPWYEKRSQFRASVSSHLGTMRAKGLIKAKMIPTGDRSISTPNGIIAPKLRVWTTNGYKITRPAAPLRIYQQAVFDQIAGISGRFHAGGLIGAMDFGRVGERVSETIVPRHVVDPTFDKPAHAQVQITVVDLASGALRGANRRLNAHPRTDDMCQMVDDIHRVEPLPKLRQQEVVEQVQRRWARNFERNIADRHMAAILGL